MVMINTTVEHIAKNLSLEQLSLSSTQCSDTESCASDFEPSFSLSFDTTISDASQLMFLCPFSNCHSPFSHHISFLQHLSHIHNLSIPENPKEILVILQEWAEAMASGSLDTQPLRSSLFNAALSKKLAQQSFERTNEWQHLAKCLFCKITCHSRPSLFAHMHSEHSLSIGQLDNLVDVSTFLDLLREKLNRNVCIYCEKIFKDAATLRKHMRKKRHFRIHGRNEIYDRFYLSSYVGEKGDYNCNDKDNEYDDDDEDQSASIMSDASFSQSHNRSTLHLNSDSEWEDWTEEESQPAFCLFCHIPSFPDAHSVVTHMKSVHSFDLFTDLETTNFYDRIRLINYARRCAALNTCFYCGLICGDSNELKNHMTIENHYKMPDKEKYSDANYLFPTNEDDPLLMIVDDGLFDE